MDYINWHIFPSPPNKTPSDKQTHTTTITRPAKQYSNKEIIRIAPSATITNGKSREEGPARALPVPTSTPMKRERGGTAVVISTAAVAAEAAGADGGEGRRRGE